MTVITEFKSSNGATVQLGYNFNSSFRELIDNRMADCFILATEYGFSPLGLAGDVIAEELALDAREIVAIADWNRDVNPKVSLVGIKAQNVQQPHFFKGAVLAASQTSKSYKSFVNDAIYSRPSRDFFYNVTYEAMHYAAHTLKARKLTISHLSASGNYHQDIATCTAEALAHFHTAYPNLLDTVLFVGCCIHPEHFKGIEKLTREETKTQHKAIEVNTSSKNGFDVLTLQTNVNRHDNMEDRKGFVQA